MPVQVRIPSAWRNLTHGQDVVEVPAGTVEAALAELLSRHPGLRDRMLDEAGAWRRSVNLFVNAEDIRVLAGRRTVLGEGDELSVLAAIAGG